MPSCRASVIPRWTCLWTFFVCLCAHFVRLGEAAVPGPSACPSVESFLDPIQWRLSADPDFVVGVCNPSGIANKHHVFEQFPVGWFHVAETQATRSQQCGFQSFLKGVSVRQQRRLRSSLGAPAPHRPGSNRCGAWTGVLTFGDCAIRSVPGLWPNGEFESGRVLLSQASVGSLTVDAATVYLPPKGPTYPEAISMGETLLTSVSQHLVFGKQGPRMILGDFNHEPGSMAAMKLWQSCGFVELQDLMLAWHGLAPAPTCKGATRSDQLWVSPELIPMIVNSATWSVFPDHCVLLAGLRCPRTSVYELQWPLPGRLPWDRLDEAAWTSSDLCPSYVACLGPLTAEGTVLLPDEVPSQTAGL